MNMPLTQLTDRIYYLPHQPERERPLLAYIHGERYSLAIDAGYSKRHVEEFYAGLDELGFRHPDFTALTHWHCDHTFGLHAIDGVAIACKNSNRRINEHRLMSLNEGYREYMISRDHYFGLEYPEGEPIIVQPAPIEYDGSLSIDLGGVSVRLFPTVAPHSSDCILALIPEERVLFLGDAIYGDPDEGWSFDSKRIKGLIDTLEDTSFDTCLASHANPHSKASMLRYLYRKMKG